MSEHHAPELSILDSLKGALGSQCPQCGETNPSSAQYCEFCNEEFTQEPEDEPSFSYMQKEGVAGLEVVGADPAVAKLPLEKSKNLILLEETMEAMNAGTIDYQKYRQNVTKVLNIAQNGVDLLSSDLVKEQVLKLPEDYQELVKFTHVYYEEFLAGCQKMMEYKGGEDFSTALEGFEMIEEALEKMDSLHDKVIDKSVELEQSKKEEAEKKEAEA